MGAYEDWLEGKLDVPDIRLIRPTVLIVLDAIKNELYLNIK